MLADLALLIWIPISLGLALTLRPPLAATLILLGGHLLLPVGRSFDLPGVPAVDRERLALLCAFVFLVGLRPARLRIGGPSGAALLALGGLLVAGALATGLGNASPLRYGPLVVPGMTLYDSVSFATMQLLDLVLPALLGFSLFRRPRELRELLALMVVAGVLYVPLVLLEVRLSPQIHRLLYGYHQHSFEQTLRFGGWRPMVLMEHGLALGLFLASCVVAALGLWRARLRIARVPMLLPAAGLGGVLVLCKSLGAIVLSALLAPVAVLLRPLPQLAAALAIAAAVLAYPVLRATDVFPTGPLTALAGRIDPDRAQSLAFRFENEDRLLAKAGERPLLGWGSFGRNRIFDPETGDDVTATDGFWIIRLGSQGLIGFVGAFGLILAPIALAVLHARRLRELRDAVVVGAVALIAALHAADQIPNGFLASFHVFLAGALAGACSGPGDEGPDDGAQPSRRVRTHSR